MHNSSTALTENILTNKVEANITSGNIVPDMSDHNQFDVDNASFSLFYNTLSRLAEKQAPLKTFSKRKLKQFSKPLITSGLKKSTEVKNSLFQSGDYAQYKLYRNKILLSLG